MRQLKYHEQKLLKKVDFLRWHREHNLRELQVPLLTLAHFALRPVVTRIAGSQQALSALPGLHIHVCLCSSERGTDHARALHHEYVWHILGAVPDSLLQLRA